MSHLTKFPGSYVDKIRYTNVVFTSTKSANGNIKSLTSENLKQNNDNLNELTGDGSHSRPTLRSTDSDYLSTIPPTEMTEMTNNYKGLEGTYYIHN